MRPTIIISAQKTEDFCLEARQGYELQDTRESGNLVITTYKLIEPILPCVGYRPFGRP
jgi:hypothetical protein